MDQQGRGNKGRRNAGRCSGGRGRWAYGGRGGGGGSQQQGVASGETASADNMSNAASGRVNGGSWGSRRGVGGGRGRQGGAARPAPGSATVAGSLASDLGGTEISPPPMGGSSGGATTADGGLLRLHLKIKRRHLKINFLLRLGEKLTICHDCNISVQGLLESISTLDLSAIMRRLFRVCAVLLGPSLTTFFVRFFFILLTFLCT